jgi:hypothetical protein
MTMTARIRVDHLTRVEGHGNIVVNVTDGVVEKCEWQVPEAPRFFEAMLRGRHYSEVAHHQPDLRHLLHRSRWRRRGGERARHRGQRAELEAARLIKRRTSTFVCTSTSWPPPTLARASVFPLVETHGEVVADITAQRLAHE